MRKMKDSGVEWIGEIPEEWEVSKVKYFYDCYDGKRVPIDASQRNEGPYPYWGAGSITGYVDNYLFDEELVLVGEDGAPFFDDTRPVSFLINEKVWINNHIHVLKIHSNTKSKFMVYFFNSVDYGTYINGSILNKLTQGNMNNIAFVVPEYEEQCRIADYLDSKCSKIDSIISKQEQIIEKLKEYKLSLITEAVTKGLNPDVEMKDSGIAWIGEIPAEWCIRSLGSVTSDIRNGYVGPTRDILAEDGVPYIQSLHVKEGKISFEKERYFVTEEWGMKHPKVHEGQIVVVQTGDIGQVGLIEKEMEGYNCHALIILTLDKKSIYQKYLQYYLRSKPGKELMLETSTGALLPHLNSGKIKSTYVLCPSLTTQRKIAEYLDNKCKIIDSAIVNMERNNIKFQEYKKSLIYEVVTGKKEV